jgi:hypothetical protein
LIAICPLFLPPSVFQAVVRRPPSVVQTTKGETGFRRFPLLYKAADYFFFAAFFFPAFFLAFFLAAMVKISCEGVDCPGDPPVDHWVSEPLSRP